MGVLREPILSLPRVASANGRKDSKSWIVHILSREWPLAAKEIYNRIHKSNGGEITYQGIHKSIRQLAIEGVLQKSGSKYSLSAEWISGLKKFGEELQDAFKGRRCVHLGEITENSSVQLVFDSFVDYFYWMIDELRANGGNTDAGDSSSYSIIYHPWPIISLSKPQFMGLKQMLSEGSHFIACKGNSAMDKSLISLWKSAGASVKLGAECGKNCDMLVFKDYVIQIFMSNSTKRELSKIYSNSQHMNGKLFSEFYRVIYEGEEPVNVLVTRNPELASQIKQEVSQEFS